MHVDPRWSEPGAFGQGRLVSQHLPEALAGVARPNQHPGRAPYALERVGQEALPMGAHGVLQGAAVDLDGVGGAPGQPARKDRRPHHEVVGQRHVRGRGVLHCRYVRVEVMLQLRIAQSRVRLRLETLVGVGDVDGQDPADVGIVDRDPLGGVPVALLAKQVHVMAQARERAHQAGVVDVAAGAPEQVAVEDQDAHRPWIFPGYRQLSFRAHASPPEVPPARPLGPRDHPRRRTGQALRGPGERRGAQGGQRRAAAGALAQQPALLDREPAALRLLAGTAGPARPQRLPSLRPAHAGGRALSARLGALLLVILALAVAGCGGDEESSADPPPKAPELTITQTDQQPPPSETETTPTTETTPPSTDGGTSSPDTPTETTPDAPENDTPPPTDSPAERFEDFCNDNPGACG